jgi:hypothetical protein
MSKQVKRKTLRRPSRKTSRKVGAKSPVRKSAKPTLLAGGNPQIAKGYGNAPVQAYIAAMPGWKRDVGRRLDALITKTVPRVRKAVKWNSPLYGVAPAGKDMGEDASRDKRATKAEDNGWFLGIHCYTRYIKVAFFRGAALKPVPPGPSKSGEVRYLDIHEHDVLDEAQLTRWIKQASKLPGHRM